MESGNYNLFQRNKNYMVVGPSMSGKNVWLYKYLDEMDRLLGEENKFDKILICYSVYQEVYDRMLLRHGQDNIFFHNGIPPEATLMQFVRMSSHPLIVFDDLMYSIAGSKLVQALFTRITHHEGCSTMCLLQTLFLPKCEYLRVLMQNAHYTIIMKSARMYNQLRLLASQLGEKELITAIYKYICSQGSYQYLVLDYASNTPDELRFKNHIFSAELPVRCYIDANNV